MLVVDLADRVPEQAVKIAGPLALSNLAQYRPYTVVKVDWPDMSTPSVDGRFWDALLADMLEISGKEPLDVLVMCAGGHGRTGTALAIIVDLLGYVPVGTDPVVWVRERYCQEAVETASQLRYIEAMTGSKVTAPIHSSWAGGTSYHSAQDGTTKAWEKYTQDYEYDGWSEV